MFVKGAVYVSVFVCVCVWGGGGCERVEVLRQRSVFV